ncbi:hypothetical protein N752_29385 [Desulforamulus aquiferis]|nr:hypothetical protein [Desulforamulus aquiferis]RYD01691.1 hypothetical protein N752_29385 [Desulforamulus aquiferis]
MKEIRIDKIKSTNELSCFVDIIRKSFATEAENFGLNEKMHQQMEHLSMKLPYLIFSKMQKPLGFI